MAALIKQHLNHAVVRMKNQADKKRLERQINEGDLVLFKLQPYVQSSLAPRANQKLSFKYFGPFEILDRVGAVAYKLKLPDQCAVHPVFHVSQLKKAVGASVPVIADLPSDLTTWQVPEKMLQKRMTNHGVRPVLQGLIKWSASLASLATWEDIEALQHHFPDAPAWGQACSLGEGNVIADTEQVAGRIGQSNEDELDGGPVGLRRSKRVQKPNRKVSGPEWIRE
jgi:hypothetical protein